MKPPTVPHALLLHYFSDGKAHPRAQGSLSADDLRRILDAYGHRLVDPTVWVRRALASALRDEACVTIDDGLREALDIALPVLADYRIKAALSVYTLPLVGVPHHLEIHRAIRNTWLGGMEDFYRRYDEVAECPLPMPGGYLADRRYLTPEDRRYRFVRNEYLSAQEIEIVMTTLAPHVSLGLNHWLSATDLRDLRTRGFLIGLHTHTHPTTMQYLTREQQATEWATSKFILESILGESVTTASWPCGQVTEYGVEWLRANGITLAWGATMLGDLPYNAPRWSSGYWRSE